LPISTHEDAATAALAERVRAGDRRSLARAITLVESTRADHRRAAQALLERLLPHASGALRIGISGAPGVGKSTFIEAFGLHLIGHGHRVAVLAVDPSSKRGGGSILGDKTRMEKLAAAEGAFVRPSPAGGTLGGVARRTREAMIVAEAAGFDVILVETVGVGQSETAVADMVDMFVLLLSPAAGDELQGIKRGIIELADLLVVTKADGDLAASARRTQAEYQHALRLMRPGFAGWAPRVVSISALSGRGIAEVWSLCREYHRALSESGALAERRAAQAKSWMWAEINEGMLALVRDNEEVRRQLRALERRVAEGRISAAAAAGIILELVGAPSGSRA
jgi:LAO/AO transport system kinase